MSRILTEVEVMELFKTRSEKRTINTCNKNGYEGYRGTVYKLGNLELFDTYSYFRFANPVANVKYLIGTTRVTKKEFITKLRKTL